jgi:hypothetical protein
VSQAKKVIALAAAVLVAAANRSTIVTAGHCVHGMDLIGNDPQWTDKVLFVPGFRDGHQALRRVRRGPPSPTRPGSPTTSRTATTRRSSC